MKTITFSVNAYNVAATVGETIQSIISVSEDYLEKIEVLVIDDGSTDDTSDIVQGYLQKYPDTIRLISKKNGGLGSAMNCGMKNAKGKYFKSIDGDDWVCTENLGDLIDYLEKVDSDMVVSDYVENYSYKSPHPVYFFEAMIPQKEYQINEVISSLKLIPYHSLFYKTSILQQYSISIDEKMYYVDTELELYPLFYINTISYINKEIYMYRLGNEEQSVSVNSLKKNVLQLERVYLSLERYFEDKYHDFYKDNVENYIKKRICRMFCLYIKVLVCLPVNISNYRKLKHFIQRTKAIEMYSYKDMSSTTVKLIYKFPALFYCPAAIFERFQNFKHTMISRRN